MIQGYWGQPCHLIYSKSNVQLISVLPFGGFRVSSYLTPPLFEPLLQEHWGPNQTLMLVINLLDPERNGNWWSFPAAATVELFNGRDFSRWCQHWAASLNSSVFQMNVSWMTFERCVPELFRRKLHLGTAARVVGVDWCVFWWRNNKKQTKNGELVSWIRYISEMFLRDESDELSSWTWPPVRHDGMTWHAKRESRITFSVKKSWWVWQIPPRTWQADMVILRKPSAPLKP